MDRKMPSHAKQPPPPPPANRGTLILSIFLATALLHCKYSDHATPAAPAAKGAAAAAVARRMLPRPVTLQSSSMKSSGAAAGASCSTKTAYFPSEFELSWLKNVTQWQEDFCTAIDAPEQTANVATWLNTLQMELATHRGEPHNLSYDPKVFSKFVTTSTCAGSGSAETVSWIEPLAHGLRHPGALCGESSRASVMSRDYLLLANSADVAAARARSRQGCVNRTCQTIFMDLGASTFDDRDIAGQGWFVRSYERLGPPFDRLLLWEGEAMPLAHKVPPEMLHKYQYFNIPAHTDLSSPSHPVRILKEIAQPGDFVVFKLDLDHAQSETAILQALLDDPVASGLVDEVFFEYHVNFGEMLKYCKSQADPSKTLADAFQLFYKLRQRGWRAHSWV